jgi:hypothetical protein
MNLASGLAVLIQILCSLSLDSVPSDALLMRWKCIFSTHYLSSLELTWEQCGKNLYTVTWMCKVRISIDTKSNCSLAWRFFLISDFMYVASRTPCDIQPSLFPFKSEQKKYQRKWGYHLIVAWI